MVKKRKDQIILLNVDSRDRLGYPNGSTTSFQVNLNYPIKNITEIALASAEIPNTNNNFDDTNNKLIIREQHEGKVFNFRIPVGNYTIPLLLSTIGSGLTNASTESGNSYTYSCSFSTITSRLTISSLTGQNFTLLWTDPVGENLAFQPLGFLPITRIGYTTSYTAENVMDLAPESYCFLQLSNVGGLSVGCNNLDVGYCFKIQMSGSPDSIVAYHSNGGGISQNIVLTQPINLNYLQVDFYSYQKKRWLNNNVDLSFTLALKIKN